MIRRRRASDWSRYPEAVQYAWVNAELRRMNRSPEETAALYQRLSRQLVRFVVSKLRSKVC